MTSILTRIERYFDFKTPIIWSNVFYISLVHLLGLYGFTLVPYAKLSTFFLFIICGVSADIALSIGTHRLWTHGTYKAKLPIRIIIMLTYMMTGQYSIVQWVRDHRTHHKYTDTDADPHSASRGLFFSHCGWLMMKRHPELKEKGKVIDISDLWQDPVIRFHQKHFLLLLLVFHVIFPSAVAYYIFGETLKNAIFITFFARYIISLNFVWGINSFAHYWGDRPYNKVITASNHPLMAFLMMGEGWHNFHHTFPWDYRIGEYGQGWQSGAFIIETFESLGLAYDLKTASPELIQKVLAKQGLPKNFEVPETGFTEKLKSVKNKEKAA